MLVYIGTVLYGWYNLRQIIRYYDIFLYEMYEKKIILSHISVRDTTVWHDVKRTTQVVENHGILATQNRAKGPFTCAIRPIYSFNSRSNYQPPRNK